MSKLVVMALPRRIRERGYGRNHVTTDERAYGRVVGHREGGAVRVEVREQDPRAPLGGAGRVDGRDEACEHRREAVGGLGEEADAPVEGEGRPDALRPGSPPRLAGRWRPSWFPPSPRTM